MFSHSKEVPPSSIFIPQVRLSPARTSLHAPAGALLSHYDSDPKLFLHGVTVRERSSTDHHAAAADKVISGASETSVRQSGRRRRTDHGCSSGV
jgi:hypothetical protein